MYECIYTCTYIRMYVYLWICKLTTTGCGIMYSCVRERTRAYSSVLVRMLEYSRAVAHRGRNGTYHHTKTF